MPTISVIDAILNDYTSPNIQTILFDLNKWSKKKAIEWLNKHGYIHKYHRLTTNQRRFMQHNPVQGAEYYSKRLPDGIVLVFQRYDDGFEPQGGAMFTGVMKQFNQMVSSKPSSLPTPSQIIQQSKPTGSGLTQYIEPQLKLAKKYSIPVDKIILSPLKTKKYRIYLKNGKHFDYGALGMEDYLMHKDDYRRQKFHNRFKNNKGYDNPNSSLFYSVRLLW